MFFTIEIIFLVAGKLLSKTLLYLELWAASVSLLNESTISHFGISESLQVDKSSSKIYFY